MSGGWLNYLAAAIVIIWASRISFRPPPSCEASATSRPTIGATSPWVVGGTGADLPRRLKSDRRGGGGLGRSSRVAGMSFECCGADRLCVLDADRQVPHGGHADQALPPCP